MSKCVECSKHIWVWQDIYTYREINADTGEVKLKEETHRKCLPKSKPEDCI